MRSTANPQQSLFGCGSSVYAESNVGRCPRCRKPLSTDCTPTGIGRIVGFEPLFCRPRQRATRLHYLSDDLGMPGWLTQPCDCTLHVQSVGEVSDKAYLNGRQRTASSYPTYSIPQGSSIMNGASCHRNKAIGPYPFAAFVTLSPAVASNI